MSEAQDIRAHLRRVGAAKSAAEASSSEPGRGLEAAVLHSDAHLAAFGMLPGDDELDVWLRVAARLRAARG